jgi:hypothetical protein
MSDSGRLFSNPWIVSIVGGLIVAIVAALIVPKIVIAVTGKHAAATNQYGSEGVKIPIGQYH